LMKFMLIILGNNCSKLASLFDEENVCKNKENRNKKF